LEVDPDERGDDMSLLKHREKGLDRFDWPLGPFPTMRWFDDLFRDADGAQLIKVEEYTEDGTLVVKAELPGFDPDTDVDVTVDGGVLRIVAEKRTEEQDEEKDFRRRELRYGSFARTLALPDGADESSVTAIAKDGILEVRIPMATEPAAEPARRIPIAHA
jgi:HSP20 family protein